MAVLVVHGEIRTTGFLGDAVPQAEARRIVIDTDDRQSCRALVGADDLDRLVAFRQVPNLKVASENGFPRIAAES